MNETKDEKVTVEKLEPVEVVEPEPETKKSFVDTFSNIYKNDDKGVYNSMMYGKN